MRPISSNHDHESSFEKLGRMGRTVLLSSHILSEIEHLQEQIVILHHGKLLAIGNLHAIREQLDNIPSY